MEEMNIIVITLSAIVGSIVTVLFNLFTKRRARFVYTVTHTKVGTTADDPNFGSIKVFHNDNPVNNLWISNLEIVNTSLSDFPNVPISITVVPPAILLNQTVKINNIDSNAPLLSEAYLRQLEVNEGNQFTDSQVQIYSTYRDFTFPVVNRNDRLTFTFLTHTTEGMPELHADIQYSGILCKYKKLSNSMPLDLSNIIFVIVLGLFLTIPALIFIVLPISNPDFSTISGYILGLTTGTIGLITRVLYIKLRKLFFN